MYTVLFNLRAFSFFRSHPDYLVRFSLLSLQQAEPVLGWDEHRIGRKRRYRTYGNVEVGRAEDKEQIFENTHWKTTKLKDQTCIICHVCVRIRTIQFQNKLSVLTHFPFKMQYIYTICNSLCHCSAIYHDISDQKSIVFVLVQWRKFALLALLHRLVKTT